MAQAALSRRPAIDRKARPGYNPGLARHTWRGFWRHAGLRAPSANGASRLLKKHEILAASFDRLRMRLNTLSDDRGWIGDDLLAELASQSVQNAVLGLH